MTNSNDRTLYHPVLLFPYVHAVVSKHVITVTCITTIIEVLWVQRHEGSLHVKYVGVVEQ